MKCVQLVSLPHHVPTHSLNLTEATYCFHHAHVYVLLLGYFVPHHYLLISWLCSRVLLCGKRKTECSVVVLYSHPHQVQVA